MIKRTRKNPRLNDIDIFVKNNSIEFEKIMRGGEATIYYFKLNNSLLVNNVLLKSGEYSLKIYSDKLTQNNHGGLSTKKISKLELLSKYGLIPKIYTITKRYIISKYIHGITVSDFQFEYPDHMDEVNEKIEKLIKIWEKLGFSHDDLSEDNILVSNKGSIYFIDPYVKN
jgi:RIO-like serine/threonine protein kinase